MKKVGIMSMQRIANYGSFLQAYALKQLIDELNCKVEFVDYHVGLPVIDEKSDSKNKYLRKLKLEEGVVKQHNLVQPSNRPVTREIFYKGIDKPGFIEHIKIGLQPKARLKSVLPSKLIQKIKSL